MKTHGLDGVAVKSDTLTALLQTARFYRKRKPLRAASSMSFG